MTKWKTWKKLHPKTTVLLGTPTFLRGYLRRVTPEQFASLDVVVVGAEKMPIDLADGRIYDSSAIRALRNSQSR